MVFTESKNRSSLEGLVAAAGFPELLVLRATDISRWSVFVRSWGWGCSLIIYRGIFNKNEG